MLSTTPCSGFLYLQFLARCHPYILISDFYTCFTHFSLTVSISTNRGLPSLVLRMVFLFSTDGYTWIIYLARTLHIYTLMRAYPTYIYAHALDLSAKIRMREIELVIHKWRRILRKLPDLAKSPSERYKLSVCIKGSCATCIQAPLYNFYGL